MSTKQFKPMLAGKVDLAKQQYPAIASAKLDGIRAIVIDCVVYSRSMKPIRNEHVQSLFGKQEFNGCDGELIVGPANAEDVYRVSSSGVMRAKGKPNVSFHVFDNIYRGVSYNTWASLRGVGLNCVKIVPMHMVENEEELVSLERKLVGDGYEGVMVRSLDGPYKQGRSTTKEGYLLKLKTFEDSEAVVLGVEELMHNNNEATIDELGHTKRSSHKENKVGGDTLGALVVQDIKSGVEFKIGTGYTQDMRGGLWANRDSLIGRIVKYKFFPGGIKEAPRFPVYLGFRHEDDMS